MRKAVKPGHYWHPEKRCWRPIVVPGAILTGSDYRPSCGQCAIPPWETCKCSSLLCERIPDALRSHGASERLNAEADERLQLALWLA